MTRRTVLAATAAAAGAGGSAALAQGPAGEGAKGPRVWLDMDQRELDDAYDQAVYAPNRDQVLKRNARNSELVRARLGPPRRFAYGPTPIEGLDVYAARAANAPIAVYVHGGAWRQRFAKEYAFPAEVLVNAGAHYVLALCREHSGHPDRAGEHDRVAAYLDPGFAMPRLHLGRLASRAGDRETARCELAQALVHDPDLLFLDEPTNGMDPKGRDEMLELVRDLAHNTGVNLILSSHLLPDVEYTCDHVVVMDKGAIVAAGPIAALKQPRGRVYELRVKMAADLDLDLFVARLRAAGLECKQTDEDVMRVFVPGEGGARELFALASAERVQVRHLRPSVPTLEDVFAHAVGEE